MARTRGDIRVSLRRPYLVKGPERAARRFTYTRIGIAQSLLDRFLNKIKTATMFDSTSLMGLSVNQCSEPPSREETQLHILILTRPVDMLQDADSECHISNNRVNCSISVLCSDLLERGAQLYQVLHDDLDHRIDLRPTGSGNVLDQKTAIGAECRSKRVHNFENPVEKGFRGVDEGLREIVRSIAASESSKEYDVLFTLQPIVFRLFAIKPGEHFAHEIINVSCRRHKKRFYPILL